MVAETAARGKVAAWREVGEPRHLTSLLDDYPELWILDRRGSASCGDLEALQSEIAGRGWLLEESQTVGRLDLLAYAPADPST